MQSAPPQEWPNQKNGINGCLVAFSIVLLLVIGGCLYKRHPRFSGTSPVAISVLVYDDIHNVYTNQVTISNRPDCEIIFQELKKARFELAGNDFDAELSISYADGKTDHLPFSQRFDQTNDESYQIFQQGYYSIQSDRFRRTLQAAGVDLRRNHDQKQ